MGYKNSYLMLFTQTVKLLMFCLQNSPFFMAGAGGGG